LLKHIYINGERYLIDELFNLFIALTKVKHLAHIVLATSDSYFIEEIYNSSKLAKTSRFFLLDHFEKNDVIKWLKNENFTHEEIETAWNYIGGCPWELSEIINEKKQGNKIQDIINIFITNSYGRIFEFKRNLKKKEKDVFNRVIKQIADKGFFEIDSEDDGEYLDILLKKSIELDIWFYIPEEHKITANSKSVQRAFEKMM
jgi:AAA+ ATPase superfamily predicted ATPase